MHKPLKPVDNSDYVKCIMALTSTFVKKISTLLTSRIHSSRAGEPLAVSSKARRLVLWAALCLAASFMQVMQLNAATLTDHYKLYLHSKLISEKQYKCAYYVAHIESRWNPLAHNAGHYGLFQMKNDKVKYLNAYQQIDMWLRYVAHRYDNKPCKAMSHLKIRNWQ